MTKYRIVSRNRSPWSDAYSDFPYYYAQRRVLGMWIDCRFNPFKGEHTSFDNELKTVERWVDRQINGSQITEEVIKTYD